MIFQRIPTEHSFSGEGLFLSVGNGWFFKLMESFLLGRINR